MPVIVGVAAWSAYAAHGYASAPEHHRKLGGGRLVTNEELVAEIMERLRHRMWTAAIPEGFPLRWKFLERFLFQFSSR